MKNTMNNLDIAKYHNYLKEDIPLEEISKALNIEEETLKRFTPEKVEAANKALEARKAEVQKSKEKQAQVAEAAAVAAAKAVAK